METKILAITLEGLGAAVVLAGILTELHYQAHTGFVLITSGSLITALGSIYYAKATHRAGDKTWRKQRSSKRRNP